MWLLLRPWNAIGIACNHVYIGTKVNYLLAKNKAYIELCFEVHLCLPATEKIAKIVCKEVLSRQYFVYVLGYK